MSRCDFEKRTVGVAGDDIMLHILVWQCFWEPPTAPYHGFKAKKHKATIYHPPNCLTIGDLSVLIFVIQIISFIDWAAITKSRAINHVWSDTLDQLGKEAKYIRAIMQTLPSCFVLLESDNSCLNHYTLGLSGRRWKCSWIAEINKLYESTHDLYDRRKRNTTNCSIFYGIYCMHYFTKPICTSCRKYFLLHLRQWNGYDWTLSCSMILFSSERQHMHVYETFHFVYLI